MAYKILSLDGGGSWAVIQAKVLQDIYGNIGGHELLREFDMAIANSGGSLVLACLCNNMMLADIIQVFETEALRKQVFSHLTLGEEFKNMFSLLEKVTGFGPKYDTPRKLTGIQKVLGDAERVPEGVVLDDKIVNTYLDKLPAIIGKPELQLIIVGYDYFRRRANFFRSKTDSATNRFSGTFNQVTLAHAIHASSNAPVNYFNEPATIELNQLGDKDRRTTYYWDGAVSGFNNPVLAGLIEAITNACAPTMDDYRILSLGTGTGDRAIITDYGESTNDDTKAIYTANQGNPLAITDHSFNFLHDVKELATSILGDPPDAATFIAYSVVHPSLTKEGNIVRINPCLKPEFNPDTKKYDYPDVYDIDDQTRNDFLALLDLDMDAVEQPQVDLITKMCDKFIIDDITKPRMANQLIRGQAEPNYLGHFFYKEAKDRWIKISSL